MEIDAPHIFVFVAMIMPVAVAVTVTMVVMILAMGVTMTVAMVMVMAVMMVPKRHHAHQVYSQAKAAHNKKLAEPLRLCPLPQPFKRLKCNLHTQEPNTLFMLALPTHNIYRDGTYIKRMPLANPLSVSTFPNPYGNRWLLGHLLITAASNPTSSATQSKNM